MIISVPAKLLSPDAQVARILSGTSSDLTPAQSAVAYKFFALHPATQRQILRGRAYVTSAVLDQALRCMEVAPAARPPVSTYLASMVPAVRGVSQMNEMNSNDDPGIPT